VKFSLISPTYNEAENVRHLVEEVSGYLRDLDYEIIICDDDSPDRTWQVAEELARANSRVRVLRRRTDRGLTRSVIDGFGIASGDIFGCIDADLQHDPAILPQMLEAMTRGADLVIGSRYVEGGSTGNWRLVRRIPSWAATKLAQWMLGVTIHDPLSGYFMLRRNDFQRIRTKLRGSGFKILLEIVANRGPCAIQEIPYTFRRRVAGTSKLTRRIVLAYLVQLWQLWRSKRERHLHA
jgi:dolichol-phosphate mannosyltransferase